MVILIHRGEALGTLVLWRIHMYVVVMMPRQCHHDPTPSDSLWWPCRDCSENLSQCRVRLRKASSMTLRRPTKKHGCLLVCERRRAGIAGA